MRVTREGTGWKPVTCCGKPGSQAQGPGIQRHRLEAHPQRLITGPRKAKGPRQAHQCKHEMLMMLSTAGEGVGSAAPADGLPALRTQVVWSQVYDRALPLLTGGFCSSTRGWCKKPNIPGSVKAPREEDCAEMNQPNPWQELS